MWVIFIVIFGFGHRRRMLEKRGFPRTRILARNFSKEPSCITVLLLQTSSWAWWEVPFFPYDMSSRIEQPNTINPPSKTLSQTVHGLLSRSFQRNRYHRSSSATRPSNPVVLSTFVQPAVTTPSPGLTPSPTSARTLERFVVKSSLNTLAVRFFNLFQPECAWKHFSQVLIKRGHFLANS